VPVGFLHFDNRRETDPDRRAHRSNHQGTDAVPLVKTTDASAAYRKKPLPRIA
jgi:hypothetical protein